MLPSREILAIVELIYFVPALFLALTVVFRHGYSKQLGWLSLILLCLLLICFSSSTIESYTLSHPSGGLITASIVFTSFGLASLLVALQGYIGRL